jgi:cysteinyl-tRNA synthetase
MLKLYNTMSRSKEEFKPRKKGKVKIFTCGPSIYRRPHIGNYRTFMYEDILVKYLEYRGYRVSRAIPLTDIEDKTILEAIKKKKKIDEITGGVEKIFFSEAKSLHIRLPKKAERASECVNCAARLIQKLMDTGHAYRYGKDIFFDPLTHKDFGKLYRLDKKNWPKKKVRFKRDTYNGNRWNRGDFILWHGYRDGDIKWWNTAIGIGRPSWNIQDPSVVIQHLGDEIDINCGGIDNIYRHHDYNIAIVESFTGKKYANYYMHGAHLIVDGMPMSKSRGNILYPEDIYTGGCRAHNLRFFLFYTHYRKKLNFTRERFMKSCGMMEEFRKLARDLTRPSRSSGRRDPEVRKLIHGIRTAFEKSMDDDLNTGAAFDAMKQILVALKGMRGRMTATDSRELESVLRKIDTVLETIF